MYEWNETVQQMIEWLEEHITENPTLLDMSEKIGYSPYYCSSQFHRICNMTVKSYLAGRRLALATIAIRDTQDRILDIAIQYGFSSQEALTRAFHAAFGCAPSAYRKNPTPLPILNRKVIYYPNHYQKLYQGERKTMSKTILTDAKTRIEYIPFHKYIGIYDDRAQNYCEFWKRHDCDEVCGIIESLRNIAHPIVSCHTAGWNIEDGEKKYFYGMGVLPQYDGIIPKGFTVRETPAGFYMVFYHPTFDYLKDNDEVMHRVEDLVWNYDIEKNGFSDSFLGYQDHSQFFSWSNGRPCYQRHYPEAIGYEILRPIEIKY